MSDKQLFLHQYGTVKHIEDAIKSGDMEGVQHNHLLKPEHVSALLDVPDEYVRMESLDTHATKPEHITKALDDEDIDVRRHAVNSSKFDPKIHFDKAFSDSSNLVHRELAAKKNLSHDQYHSLAKLDNKHISRVLSNNPATPSDVIEHLAVHSSDPFAKEAAAKRYYKNLGK